MDDDTTEPTTELSEDLSETSASLIHDISTPLAIVKVNCEFITRYLPRLLESYRLEQQSDAAGDAIPPAHLEALSKAPEVVIEQVTLVQQRALRYWREMEQKLKDAAPVASTTAGESINQGPSLRFLCVEDNIALQDATLKLLTPHHDVDIATNSREALKKCAEHRYDVVLVNAQLMDDRLTGKSIAQAADNHPQIIALVDRATAQRDIPGCDARLTRPLQAQELIRCLKDNDSKK